MPSKRQRDQRNAARAASNSTYKKRRLEASLLPKPVQLQPHDTSYTYDTSDTESESGTWYWNESANESDSDTEAEGRPDIDEEDESRTEESRIQEEARPEVSLMDMRWNRDGESSLRGGYGNGSKSSSQRQKKYARDFEREASQTYNIGALWQRNRNLGLISAANSQIKPGEPSQLLPNNSVSSAFPLSDIPRGGPPPLSK